MRSKVRSQSQNAGFGKLLAQQMPDDTSRERALHLQHVRTNTKEPHEGHYSFTAPFTAMLIYCLTYYELTDLCKQACAHCISRTRIQMNCIAIAKFFTDRQI